MMLLGSKASPYVRRIRLLLADREYEFVDLNIFSKEGQDKLSQYTQTRRVPVLIDGELVIWDSLLITKHLLERSLDLEEEKRLVMLNEANDSGITLYQLKKFQLDPHYENIFSKVHLSRIKGLLGNFEKIYAAKKLSWDLEEQWLYCMLDWFDFRHVYDWRGKLPNLVKFFEASSDYEFVQESSPGLLSIS